MKQNKMKILSVVAGLLVFAGMLSLTSCSESKTLEIVGTWDTSTSGDGSSLFTFSEDSFSVKNTAWDWDYSGEIIQYDNNKYNVSGDTPTSGDCGYMVIKYTEHTSGSSYEGKFNIIRWNNLVSSDDSSTMLYSEGYNSGVLFDSVDAAISGASNDSGYFSTYSKAVKQ